MTLKQQQWQTFFQERLIPFLERQAPEDVVLIVEPVPADGMAETATLAAYGLVTDSTSA